MLISVCSSYVCSSDLSLEPLSTGLASRRSSRDDRERRSATRPQPGLSDAAPRRHPPALLIYGRKNVMKATAAIVRAVGEPFNIEEIDVADPQGSDVRVRMVGAGMCHTEPVARDGSPVHIPIVQIGNE